MTRIAITVTRDRIDATLAPHFGNAKWVMLHDSTTGETEFIRNDGLRGHWVVQLLGERGCSDTVFSTIGGGALQRLAQAGIKAWQAPEGTPADQLLRQLAAGELQPASDAAVTQCSHHGDSHSH